MLRLSAHKIVINISFFFFFLGGGVFICSFNYLLFSKLNTHCLKGFLIASGLCEHLNFITKQFKYLISIVKNPGDAQSANQRGMQGI